jgi:hypothetical protein
VGGALRPGKYGKHIAAETLPLTPTLLQLAGAMIARETMIKAEAEATYGGWEGRRK